jgi:hypothetical protein
MRPEAEALTPDPRFATTVALEPNGTVRPLTFADHYGLVASLDTITGAPAPVRNAFQRALHCFLYSWFDYEMMIVAEGQAFASFELALKLRLNRPADAPPLHGMGPRLKAAIDAGLLPPPDPEQEPDEYFLLRSIRNELAHGSGDIHPPALVIEVFKRCAALITTLYPA